MSIRKHSLLLFLITLSLHNFSTQTVLQTKSTTSSSNSSLADYALQKANKMGISKRELLIGLNNLHKPGAAALSRRLFLNGDSYELQKERNADAERMFEDVENGYAKMVLDEEVNQDSEEDDEMNELSDNYMRIRDYIDHVRNVLKEQMDQMQHDMEIQQKIDMQKINEEH